MEVVYSTAMWETIDRISNEIELGMESCKAGDISVLIYLSLIHI